MSNQSPWAPLLPRLRLVDLGSDATFGRRHVVKVEGVEVLRMRPNVEKPPALHIAAALLREIGILPDTPTWEIRDRLQAGGFGPPYGRGDHEVIRDVYRRASQVAQGVLLRRGAVHRESVTVGDITELDGRRVQFTYHPSYQGPAIDSGLAVGQGPFESPDLRAPFRAMLPSGAELADALRRFYLPPNDLLGLLLAIGWRSTSGLTVWPE